MPLFLNHSDDKGFSFIVIMLLMPCSLASHFISRKDVGTAQPASLSSIAQLKLVGLPVIWPYIQRKMLPILTVGIIIYIMTSKLIELSS